MPRGSAKRERQYEHIKASAKQRGGSTGRAKDRGAHRGQGTRPDRRGENREPHISPGHVLVPARWALRSRRGAQRPDLCPDSTPRRAAAAVGARSSMNKAQARPGAWPLMSKEDVMVGKGLRFWFPRRWLCVRTKPEAVHINPSGPSHGVLLPQVSSRQNGGYLLPLKADGDAPSRGSPVHSRTPTSVAPRRHSHPICRNATSSDRLFESDIYDENLEEPRRTTPECAQGRVKPTASPAAIRGDADREAGRKRLDHHAVPDHHPDVPRRGGRCHPIRRRRRDRRAPHGRARPSAPTSTAPPRCAGCSRRAAR